MAIRVLIYSHDFWPSVGGVETYAGLVAEGMAGEGTFRTTVVTQTPHSGAQCDRKFEVFRSSGLRRLWQLVRAPDGVFMVVMLSASQE